MMSGLPEIDFDFDFDYEALEAVLRSCLARAFTSLQLDFPDERFYNFTLFISSGMRTVSIAANSEACLDATVREYREQDPKYAAVDFDATKALFRYEFLSFCFFARGHDMRAYDAMLEKAYALLAEFGEKAHEVEDYLLERLDDDDDAADEYIWPLYEALSDIFERVMKGLDDDKVFELNSQRGEVTLLMQDGDIEADAYTVAQLNPDNVYRRFLKDLELAGAARRQIDGS